MVAPVSQHQINWATPLPEMGDGPISVEPYVSEEFFEQEKAHIFRKAWIQVCREDHLPDPGDYMVIPMEVWNSEIIVVRGKDSQVRAFHNICRHRGMKVIRREMDESMNFQCGNGHVMICPFHGWTYNNDGTLRPLMGEEYFPDIDREQLGLVPVTLDSWNGFLFVHYQSEPEQGLREFLGALADDMEEYPFDQFTHIARYSATVKSNWKASMDAFHEAYHAATLHGVSVPDAARNPETIVPTSARVYGPHHSLSMWSPSDYQPSPAAVAAWKYGQSFAAGGEMDLPGANPSKDEAWWFDINVFFPNFFCDTGPGWYFTYNFRPISVSETVWVMDIYQTAAQTCGQRIAQEHTKVMLRDIVYEDLSTLEQTQEMLASGVIDKLHISSELEVAVRHLHATACEWVEQGEQG
ncbi:MAG TPA: hypothetical protein DCF45_02820 [Gammaproteobacteria bacterium]|nr:hypothetical protein [Gammaproteobacteria bacterium]